VIVNLREIKGTAIRKLATRPPNEEGEAIEGVRRRASNQDVIKCRFEVIKELAHTRMWWETWRYNTVTTAQRRKRRSVYTIALPAIHFQDDL